MSKIADKHGLTNQYREASIGKRVVKRGRPRKYLFGTSKKRTQKIDKTTEDIAVVGIGCLLIVLLIAFIITIIVMALISA